MLMLNTLVLNVVFPNNVSICGEKYEHSSDFRCLYQNILEEGNSKGFFTELTSLKSWTRWDIVNSVDVTLFGSKPG